MKAITEFAARLNGREYTSEITKKEEKEAKALGFIVAFGASDDLLELRGAICEEYGAIEGGDFQFTQTLALIDERDDYEELVSSGWIPPKPAFSISARWCPEDVNTSWQITSSLPFAHFDIMEDGELYCRGAVIDCSSLAVATVQLSTADGV